MAHMHSYMRYLCTLLFLLSITLLWFYSLYQPLNTKISSRIDAQNCMQRAVKTIAQTSECKRLLKKKCVALARNELFVPACSLQRMYGDSLFYVFDLIQHVSLTLESYSVGDPVFHTMRTTYDMHVVVRGTLQHVHIFFNSLAAASCVYEPVRIVCTFYDADQYVCTSEVQYTFFKSD